MAQHEATKKITLTAAQLRDLTAFKHAAASDIRLDFRLSATTSTSSTSYSTVGLNAWLTAAIEEAHKKQLEELFMEKLKKEDVISKHRAAHIICVTFGDKYRREKHTHIPEVHPDGWVEFHCSSAKEFETLKQRFLRLEYSRLYTKQEFNPEGFYPKGCLRVITREDLIQPISLTDHLD